VETTYLTIRFPRLHFQQVVPRRYTRRFANLLLKVCPKWTIVEMIVKK